MVFENGRVEGQPNEGRGQEDDCDQAQAAVWQTAKQPEQCDSFAGPAEGDPFAIELERED
jgi:hypothetical protein